jgi:hypothetical protein
MDYRRKYALNALKERSGSWKPRNNYFAAPEETGIDGKSPGAEAPWRCQAPGETVGELALLIGEPRSHTAIPPAGRGQELRGSKQYVLWK